MERVWKINLRNWGRLEDTNMKQILKECNKPAQTVKGFNTSVVRAVTENCRTLKIDQSGFEV